MYAKPEAMNSKVQFKTNKMKSIVIAAIVPLFLQCLAAHAQQVVITSISINGDLTWTSPYTNDLHVVEWASGLGGTNPTWTPLTSVIVTNPTTSIKVPTFYRVTAATNADPIVGVWTWFSGDRVRFFADGNLMKTNVTGKGTWLKPHKQQFPQQYLVLWDSVYVDNLTLSTTNGFRLQGYNQFGTFVSASKIAP
jgi:hypothetical protein